MSTEMNENPYRNLIDTTYKTKNINKIRWEKTLKFLQPFKNIESGLDIGDRSPLTNLLEEYFNTKFDNTEIDLDEEGLSGNYNIITSFEVIEHLFNPLFHLKQVKKVLDENGILYLSTPLLKPEILQSPEHFHEMTFESLNTLTKMAGFKISRFKVVRVRPFSVKGFRMILRYFFERIIFLELRHS